MKTKIVVSVVTLALLTCVASCMNKAIVVGTASVENKGREQFSATIRAHWEGYSLTQDAYAYSLDGEYGDYKAFWNPDHSPEVWFLK